MFDSHPLALGATPKQVYIDGIPQLESPFIVRKPKEAQEAPKVPNFDKEAQDAIKYEGLPPLLTEKNRLTGDVLFTNVTDVYMPARSEIRHSQLFRAVVDGQVFPPSVLVQKGRITCMGRCTQEKVMAQTEDVTIIDLEGGALSPGLVSFGAPLGLEEIQAEKSTNDGMVIDPLTAVTPKILDDGEGGIIRAADGLAFMGRDTLCVVGPHLRLFTTELSFVDLHIVPVLPQRYLPRYRMVSWPALVWRSRLAPGTNWKVELLSNRLPRCMSTSDLVKERASAHKLPRLGSY